MAKKETAAKRGRGRPVAADPLSERVLVRLTVRQKGLADALARLIGVDGPSSALRVLLMERAKKEGLL